MGLAERTRSHVHAALPHQSFDTHGFGGHSKTADPQPRILLVSLDQCVREGITSVN